ncbi:3-oxoacid CoA-transferase subunit A [Mycoplasmatota bacterium]|nr:3-oxoacid CoA-transferase subunit A [Mycoplasmatota bacterium]
MTNKIISKAQFIEKLRNGISIMVGGFMAVGTPENLIDEIVNTEVKDLTIICNDAGLVDKGVGKLITAGKVKKLIASHIGLNPEAGKRMSEGTMDVILVPQGTLAEQIRAGGSGLGGFLTPTGLGTTVEEGKEIVNVDGVDYILEKPLKADMALILGHRADEKGNTIYNKTTRNFNPLMATACETVIVEAKEVVKLGELDPDHIVTPHIFVDYLIGGKE